MNFTDSRFFLLFCRPLYVLANFVYASEEIFRRHESNRIIQTPTHFQITNSWEEKQTKKEDERQQQMTIKKICCKFYDM